MFDFLNSVKVSYVSLWKEVSGIHPRCKFTCRKERRTKSRVIEVNILAQTVQGPREVYGHG